MLGCDEYLMECFMEKWLKFGLVTISRWSDTGRLYTHVAYHEPESTILKCMLTCFEVVIATMS
jgi:hypothetical protein